MRVLPEKIRRRSLKTRGGIRFRLAAVVCNPGSTEGRAIAFGSISIFAVMDRSYNLSYHTNSAFAVRAGHTCDNGLPYSVPNAITLALKAYPLDIESERPQYLLIF
jgi:hypothetical protein